jgi:hypothetical protein
LLKEFSNSVIPFWLISKIVEETKKTKSHMYDLRLLGSGNPATVEMPFSSSFSLPPFYLALAYAGWEKGGGVV